MRRSRRWCVWSRPMLGLPRTGSARLWRAVCRAMSARPSACGRHSTPDDHRRHLASSSSSSWLSSLWLSYHAVSLNLPPPRRGRAPARTSQRDPYVGCAGMAAARPMFMRSPDCLVNTLSTQTCRHALSLREEIGCRTWAFIIRGRRFETFYEPLIVFVTWSRLPGKPPTWFETYLRARRPGSAMASFASLVHADSADVPPEVVTRSNFVTTEARALSRDVPDYFCSKPCCVGIGTPLGRNRRKFRLHFQGRHQRF